MNMTMRERIARALLPAVVYISDYDEVTEDEAFTRPRYQHLREVAYGAADAVLDVMREPDEGMLKAGFKADDEAIAESPGFYVAKHIWQAMIDSAKASE
jgi:hypothetical protein